MVEVKQMDTVSYFKSILRRFEEEFGAYGVSFHVRLSTATPAFRIQADWRENGQLCSARFAINQDDGQFSFDYDSAARSLKYSLELTGGGDDA